MGLRRKLNQRTRIGLSIPILLSALAGCATTKPPAPLAKPAVESSVRHHFGNPLVSPTTRPITPDAAQDALAITVTWTAIEAIPPGLDPVTPTARMISDAPSGRPIIASGSVTRGVRIAPSDMIDSLLNQLVAGKFGRSTPISEVQGALPADVTGVFDLHDTDLRNGQRIALAVYRPAKSKDQLQLAVTINREGTLLDPMTITEPARIGVVIPTPFAGSESRAVLAVIDVSTDRTPENAEVLAKAVAELSQAPAASTQPAAPADWTGLSATVASLSPTNARSALIYLSSETGAALCADIALVADDETIAKLSDRVKTKVGQSTQPLTKPQIAWALDVSCFEELSPLQSTEKMPPELSAVVTSYAGEAGRHASSLEEIAKTSTTLAEIDARITAENLLYLEDVSPASRVRAYDWLSGRGKAPPGYDPLGPSKQRRTALDQALYSNTTTNSSANSGGAK